MSAQKLNVKGIVGRQEYINTYNVKMQRHYLYMREEVFQSLDKLVELSGLTMHQYIANLITSQTGKNHDSTSNI